MPSVWLLNLDADHELARPLGYTPTDAVLARVEVLRPRVRADLFEPGDIECLPGRPLTREARGMSGRAWCMTPRARKLLLAVGATPVESPALEVLQRVNARAFAHRLVERDETSVCSSVPAELEAFLERAPSGTEWLAKRAHGMAGRGQRRISAGSLTLPDAQWLARSCEQGGVLIEARRELELECIVHGDLGASGGLWLGPVLQQRCDAFGAWMENRPDPPISPAERDALSESAELAARALVAAGYFGPFGLDSYAWIESGERRWNRSSDLNARYTMGWSRGLLHRRA